MGDLGPFEDGGLDFVKKYNGHKGAVAWWNDNWTEFIRDVSDSWTSAHNIPLPAGQKSVWVAFWLDNGEADKGAIDNVVVANPGTNVPEPATMLLLGSGLFAFAALRRYLTRTRSTQPT